MTNDLLDEWQPYLTARKSGIKKHWKALLNERVASIDQLSTDERASYLDRLCSAVFDDQQAIPIEHPVIWCHILTRWQERLTQNPEHEQTLLWLVKAMGFNGTYKILQVDPDDILKGILQRNPSQNEAQRMLLKSHLDSLDFALHELPHGLLIRVDICRQLVAECEQLIQANPDLAECKTRFNLDLNDYRSTLNEWLNSEQYKEDDNGSGNL